MRLDKAQEAQPARARPADMPVNAPPSKGDALRGTEKPKDVLPTQRPVTDEPPPPKPPARWKVLLLKVCTALLVVVALALGYVFLLLGEPDEDSAYTQQIAEERIAMPMNAVESPGDISPASLADTFGKPVLYLYGSELTMERSRVYDTAFQGGYARRASITYAFSDGQRMTLESIRPTAAVTLLSGDGYTLDADSLYTIGGVDAARMDGAADIYVFGQTDSAVYAVRCPVSHADEMETLLKQTALASKEEP